MTSAGSGGEPYAELQQRVSRAVRRHAPRWLQDQVDDIVQNVMIKLHRLAESGEGTARFSASYLEKTAYSAVVDEIRRAYRRKDEAVDDAQLQAHAREDDPAPDRLAVSGEIGAGILDCLRGLVHARRLAVTYYLLGCSVPETARYLRWPAKKAENGVYRGLADLRACLKRKGLAP